MPPQADRTAWLQSRDAECRDPRPLRHRPWHIVLLGPPGVGKGTLAARLVQDLKACHLSTGDVFRAALSVGCERPTRAMQAALKAMKRGELVKDETVIELVRERIHCLECRHGFLLDGFPRTEEQAEALEGMLAGIAAQLDAAILLEAPAEVITERISGRRTCARCNATWHLVHQPPRRPETCDHCGGRLQQRDDDRPAAIHVRLETYRKTIDPVIDFYRRRHVLREVDASGDPGSVAVGVRRLLDALENRVR